MASSLTPIVFEFHCTFVVLTASIFLVSFEDWPSEYGTEREFGVYTPRNVQ